MRRLFVLIAALALLAGNVAAVTAQDATPGAMGPSKLSQLGLPTLNIALTAEGIQAPAEIAAGEVLLVLDNQKDAPDGVSIVKLPEGTSIEDAMMLFGPPPAPEGTPGADMEASPAGEEEMGPPPPLFYEMTWGGGAFAMPGVPGEIVVTLTPGQWYIVGGPESGAMPVSLTVTGDEAASPTAGTEITADVEVTADNENGHFYFEIPENLAAGDQIWKVTNSGDQPHEMFITKTPRRLTLDEVNTLITLPEGELPPEGMPNPAEFQDMGGIAPISGDQTVYAEFNLEPGAYVAICFMPDKENGMPHALEGMVVVFEIPEEGQTVEPPASPAPMDHNMEMGTPTS
jgi:hypothetical protein